MNPRVVVGGRATMSAEAAAEMITNSGDETEEEGEIVFLKEEKKGKPHLKKRLANGFKGNFLSRGKQMVNMVLQSMTKNSDSSGKSGAIKSSPAPAATNGKNGKVPHDDADEYDFKDVQQTPPSNKMYGRIIQSKANGSNSKTRLRHANNPSASGTSPLTNIKRPVPALNHINGKKRVFEEDLMDLDEPEETETKRKREESKVDISVLRELPEEIRKEMAQHYGIDMAELEIAPYEPASPLLYSPTIEAGIEAKEFKPNDSSDETIEAVLKASKLEAESQSSINPYENVDEIDPTFLCALPNNLRNEVLLQVQEAKEKRGINIPQNLLDSPQPCSSRQFLERQKLRRLAAEKAAAAAAGQNGAVNGVSSPPALVPVRDEDLIDIKDGMLETPPPEDPQVFTPTPPSTSDSGGNRSTRLNGKWSSTRRKLNFDEDGSDMKRFTNRFPKATIAFYPPAPSKRNVDVSSSSEEDEDERGRFYERKKSKEDESFKIRFGTVEERPALNDEVDEYQVHKVITKAILEIKNPTVGDISPLFDYFDNLVSGGWIDRSVALLKFLFQELKKLDEDSPWHPLLADLIHECQANFQNHCGGLLS